MKPNYFKKCLTGLAAATLITLAGCPRTDVPVPAQTDFTTFVKDLLAQTTDDTQPVEIDELDFAFDESPAAFDDVLAGDAEVLGATAPTPARVIPGATAVIPTATPVFVSPVLNLD